MAIETLTYIMEKKEDCGQITLWFPIHLWQSIQSVIDTCTYKYIVLHDVLLTTPVQ